MKIQEVNPYISILEIEAPNHNALSSSVLKEIENSFQSIESNPQKRIIIITGAGKSFVAGGDIKEMKDLSESSALSFVKLGHQVFNRIEQSKLISIAAINGFALGGGLELALSCDLRFASEKATLGLPESSLGLIPGFGGTQRLTSIIGVHQALYYTLTANYIPLEKALSMNLILEITAAEELINKSQKIAEKIISNGALTTQAIKKLVSMHKASQNGLEQEQLEFSKLFNSKEPQIGLNAFLNKEKPNFS